LLYWKGRSVLEISIHADIKVVTKGLSALAYKQLPFAQAQAATAFPTATPFTLNSVGVKAARKDNPVAIVFVKDIAAQYLAPFEEGGVHFLGSKRGLLVPIDQAVNQYGNLPRNALAKLKNRPDVFIGSVKTKRGEVINGVWQRSLQRGNGSSNNTSASLRNKVRGQAKRPRGANTSGQLKLLIRFKDTQQVKQHIGWGSKARATVRAWWKKEFGLAMSKAIAQAK
jgi:hypothetical protein